MLLLLAQLSDVTSGKVVSMAEGSVPTSETETM